MAAGTLIPTPNGFVAQFSIGGGKRKGALLRTCTTRDEALERKDAIAALVTKLRKAGQGGLVPKTIEDAAGFEPEDLRKLARLVDRIAAGQEQLAGEEHPIDRTGITFNEFATMWTSGDLHRKYPDHVREKRSADDDAYRVKILSRAIGDLPLSAFRLEHAEDAMRRVDELRQESENERAAERKGKPRKLPPLDAGGRRQYAQLLHRVLKLATYPARILTSNPLPSGWLPRGTSNKAKSFLYPDEERAVLACAKIPMHYRVLYGFLARSGLRADEACSLTMSDVDLKRGVVNLDENKTDDPRIVVLSEDVVRALDAWKRRYRGKALATSPFFIRPKTATRRKVARIRVDGLAARYREKHLPAAKITRRELFARTATRIPLRVHDLRAAFVTYALANGKTETWVMDRTGHKSSQMVNRYRRIARSVSELRLGQLAPLDEALPDLVRPSELQVEAPKAASEPLKYEPETTKKVSDIGSIAQSVELRTFNRRIEVSRVPEEAFSPGDRGSAQVASGRLGTPACTPVAGSMQDARDDEAVLLDAIARAELEGRRTVADALARALGALRNVRAAGNVVALDTVRPKLKQGP